MTAVADREVDAVPVLVETRERREGLATDEPPRCVVVVVLGDAAGAECCHRRLTDDEQRGLETTLAQASADDSGIHILPTDLEGTELDGNQP